MKLARKIIEMLEADKVTNLDKLNTRLKDVNDKIAKHKENQEDAKMDKKLKIDKIINRLQKEVIQLNIDIKKEKDSL